MTEAMTELTPLLPFAAQGSMYAQAKERPPSKEHQRIDLYSIYLTSLLAHFEEELEKTKVSRSLLRPLCVFESTAERRWGCGHRS